MSVLQYAAYRTQTIPNAMKITVTQLNCSRLEDQWQTLRNHLAAHATDLLLLPEFPFAPWFPALDKVDLSVWEDAVRAHKAWIKRLPELNAAVVAGTLPITHENGARRNMAFLWNREDGLMHIREKTYLPSEPGFAETDWYERGPVDFQAVSIGNVRVGFLICTELWFFEHARAYAQQNVDLLLVPRSTELATNEKWRVGGRTAGIVGGAYCLSSNHAETINGWTLGGAWVTDPDGTIIGTTSTMAPFFTVDIDLEVAREAKSTYPRYVET